MQQTICAKLCCTAEPMYRATDKEQGCETDLTEKAGEVSTWYKIAFWG